MKRPARCMGLPGRRRCGFTLVEVLVALTIMALIAAMGWQGVAGMARSREFSAEATERTLRLSTVVAQWEHDLQAVYDSPVVPGLSFDGAQFRLVRRQGAGGVQVVVWALRAGLLQRWAGPVVQRGGDLQDSWLQALQMQGQEADQVTLLQDVARWNLLFSRGGHWSNAQSSGDLQRELPPTQGETPNPRTQNPLLAPRLALPQGVRLELELAAGRLTRDVVVAPQMPS